MLLNIIFVTWFWHRLVWSCGVRGTSAAVHPPRGMHQPIWSLDWYRSVNILKVPSESLSTSRISQLVWKSDPTACFWNTVAQCRQISQPNTFCNQKSAPTNTSTSNMFGTIQIRKFENVQINFGNRRHRVAFEGEQITLWYDCTPYPPSCPHFITVLVHRDFLFFGLFVFLWTQSNEASLHGGLIEIMETCWSLETWKQLKYKCPLKEVQTLWNILWC